MMIFGPKDMMNLLNLRQPTVLGSGVMGCGIAICFAQIDLPVILWTRGRTGKIRRKIKLILQNDFDLNENEQERFLNNIYITSELSVTAESDFLLEAVVEDLEVKRRLFLTLCNLCAPSAIIATNTSTIPIRKIASIVHFPQRVIGMHFFFPAYKTDMIEIICSQSTSWETFSVVRNLAALLKKEVIKAEDKPGFLVDRLFLAHVANAIRLLESEDISPEKLDHIMCRAYPMNFPPLVYADQIGLAG